MARVAINHQVEKVVTSNWQPLSGASIQVNLRNAGAATIFSAETAGVTLSNPLTTDANGRVSAWIDEGSYDLVVSGTGITTYTLRIEALRGDGLNTITTSTRLANGVVGTTQIADNAITTVKIGSAQVTAAKLAADTLALTVPTGVLLAYGGTSAPTGFLLCDGSAVNRTTFSALFSVIGTAFGTGDGSTTFNVPDSRSRSLMGAGTGSGLSPRTLAGKLGEETHLLSTSEMPAHSHSISLGYSDPGHAHTVAGGSGVLITSSPNFFSSSAGSGGAPAVRAPAVSADTAGTGISFSPSIGNNGSGSNHNTVHPVLVVNHIVKT